MQSADFQSIMILALVVFFLDWEHFSKPWMAGKNAGGKCGDNLHTWGRFRNYSVNTSLSLQSPCQDYNALIFNRIRHQKVSKSIHPPPDRFFLGNLPGKGVCCGPVWLVCLVGFQELEVRLAPALITGPSTVAVT